MNDGVDSKGLQAALFTAAAWGLTGILIKLLPGYSPIVVTAGRLLISLVITMPIVLVVRKLRRAAAHAVRRGVAWWLGVLAVAYYGLAVAGYSMAPVSEVALMLSTTPLFVLAANLARGVHPTRQELAGAGIAVVGICVVILPGMTGGEGFSPERLFGNALGLASSASAGGSALVYRALTERREAPDAFGVAVIAFLLGSVLLSGIAVTLVPPAERAVPFPEGFGVLVALAVICTLLPTITYAVASQRLPPVLNTTIRLLIPVFAAIIAAFVLGELPSWWVVPGGALVLGGILIMLRQPTPTVEAASEAPLGD